MKDRIIDKIKSRKDNVVYMEDLWDISIPINDIIEKYVKKRYGIDTDKLSDDDTIFFNNIHDEIQGILEKQFGYPDYSNYNWYILVNGQGLGIWDSPTESTRWWDASGWKI